MRLAPVSVLMAGLYLALPFAAIAQGAGQVRGVVLDEEGAPVVGASIVVTGSRAGIAPAGAVTDASGSFVVSSLPPGRGYTVQAVFPGFAAMVIPDVAVAAGAATTLRITLARLSSYRERVEVRARPQIVTLEDTTAGVTFTGEFLDGLPILGRNYQDVLTLAPGVVDPDGDGDPNIHGARDTDVGTLVDGVSVTDPLTGKRGAQLNIESIQEIEVKTAGATAEFSRAQGGFANIITKSGGNEFQGTFKFYWRGSALDGDGAGADDARLHAGIGERGLRDLTFDDLRPFLSVEGPLARDRAWYFLALESVSVEEPVNALNSAFVRAAREMRQFLKLTWQAHPSHRLALSINHDPQEYFNEGLNSFTREESGYTSRFGGPITTAKAVSVLGPSVSVESSMSYFDERPGRAPTLHPDTNGNGVLEVDYNRNGFIEAYERDPGDDYDRDGRFDVFEDGNRNGALDLGAECTPGAPCGEDRDGDRRLTPAGGCEGAGREDRDCDGRLDVVMEDANGNGALDAGEDVDGDRRLDAGTEDRNGNKFLDDTPTPSLTYPYGRLRPLPSDREYEITQSGVVQGPFYEDFTDRRRRLTFRQDITGYVHDYWGSHDLKGGVVVEREDFARRTSARGILAPILRSAREGPSTVRALLPAEREVANDATGRVTGLYVQDNYKPFPNLSLQFGLRFDREIVDTWGYTFFDPAAERARYDRLLALAGDEARAVDAITGDGNGVVSQGILGDPLFRGSDSVPPATATASITDPMRLAALSRLTRHHVETRFHSAELAALYPAILDENGDVDPRELSAIGIVPQARARFALSNNNLAPRFALSWDPAADGRSKIFATWGRYYDKLFLSTIVGEEGPDAISRYYVLDADGVTGNGTPDFGIGRIVSKAPPSATQIDRGLQTPFSDEFTLGFEREIAPEVAVSLRYVQRRYRQQLQDMDVNHTLRYDASGLPLDTLGGYNADRGPGAPPAPGRPADGRPDLFIYNHFFNEVLRVGNFNEARYRGVEIALYKRLARRWEMQGSYTYSRALGAAESFTSRLGNDPSTIESEFGYLDYDLRHVVKLNAIVFLPRDWQIGGALSWSSGLPYSVVSRFFALDNVDYAQYRTVYGYTERGPRFVPQRRNVRRNPAMYDVNLRARKALVIGRHSAAVFLEVFNALNQDDLRIFTFEPHSRSGFTAGDPTRQGPLQLDAVRRFGRRFQIGLQFDF